MRSLIDRAPKIAHRRSGPVIEDAPIDEVAVRDAIKDGAIGQPTFGYVYWPTGRIGSNGTHFFDAINFMLDSTPTEIIGRVQYGLDLSRVDNHPGYAERSKTDPAPLGFIT